MKERRRPQLFINIEAGVEAEHDRIACIVYVCKEKKESHGFGWGQVLDFWHEDVTVRIYDPLKLYYGTEWEQNYGKNLLSRRREDNGCR